LTIEIFMLKEIIEVLETHNSLTCCREERAVATSKNEKKVYTTGAVAKLFGININTVIKWFDEGKIDGFRLPISNDRRIPIGSLKTFMVSNNIPMDLLGDSGPMRRMCERVDMDNMIEFTATNGSAYGPYPGKLTNISQSGARIQAIGADAVSIPMHSFRLNVTIKDGPLADTVLPGSVVHMQPGDTDLSIGIKFNELTTDHHQRLSHYLETRSA